MLILSVEGVWCFDCLRDPVAMHFGWRCLGCFLDILKAVIRCTFAACWPDDCVMWVKGFFFFPLLFFIFFCSEQSIMLDEL